MIRRKRAPALILLAALVLFVGVPPSLIAQDRLPASEIVSVGEAGSTQSAPVMAANDGDPDDWATTADSGNSLNGTIQGKTGGHDGGWLNYVESIRNLILRIKMELGGIL